MTASIQDRVAARCDAGLGVSQQSRRCRPISSAQVLAGRSVFFSKPFIPIRGSSTTNVPPGTSRLPREADDAPANAKVPSCVDQDPRSPPARHWPATRSGRNQAPWEHSPWLLRTVIDRPITRRTLILARPDHPASARGRLRQPSRLAIRPPPGRIGHLRGPAGGRVGRRSPHLAPGPGPSSASSNSAPC
jgi:hypothetical protein